MTSNLFLLLLIISQAQSLQTIVWSGSLGQYSQVSFVECLANEGQTIKGILSFPPSTPSPASLIISIYSPDSSYSSSPYQLIHLECNSNYNNFETLQLNISGLWKVVILPQADSPLFIYQLDLFSNGVFMGYYTGVARKNRIFISYLQTTNASTNIIQLSSNVLTFLLQGEQALGQTYVQMYKGNSGVDMSLSALISNISSNNNSSIEISYLPEMGKVYYAVIFIDNSLDPNINITVQFDTDSYPCPYFSPYIDVDKQFLGCYANANINNTVTVDAPVNNSPPLPSYSTQCGNGTFSSNGICLMNPKGCLSYNPILSECNACQSGLYLNLTFQCQPLLKDCSQYQLGSVLINNKCLTIVQNCLTFSNESACLACQTGYILNSGSCIQATCPDRQFVDSNGLCSAVSIYCLTYNKSNGFCTTCNVDYQLQFQTGQCLFSPSQLQANGCIQRRFLLNNKCIEVDPLCDQFDLYSGRCSSCLNPLLKVNLQTGNCTQSVPSCLKGYFYSNLTLQCQEISKYCSLFNFTTQRCDFCLYNMVNFRGNCMYLPQCKINEVRNSTDGSCYLFDPNCVQTVVEVDKCLVCGAKYDLVDGICCYSQNYLISSSCLPYLKAHCSQLMTQFGYCLQCSLGFIQKNGLFGPCSSIS